jgi:hypothetical protein
VTRDLTDEARKWTDEDVRKAAELLDILDSDLQAAISLLIFTDSFRDLLKIKTPSTEPAMVSKETTAQHGVEQSDAQWFYDKGLSDVGTEQISG